MAALLEQQDVVKRLADLPGWEQDGSMIVKEFRFGAYLDGIAFVSKLGEAAESMNHHPDLLVRLRKVQVRLSTHSAGGLTELDFALAAKAEEIGAGVQSGK